MSKKDLLKEICWCFSGLIISLAFSAVYFSHSNVMVSDIYVGFQRVDASVFDRLKNIIVLSFAGLLYSPILFSIYLVRAILKKFAYRPLNIFLIFISLISVASSLLIALNNEILALLFGSVAIYPPLSAIPDSLEVGDATYIFIWTFISVQILFFVIAVRKVRKRKA